MSKVAILAAVAFERSERVRMMEMMNTPLDYEERKKAFVALAEAREDAALATRLLNEAGGMLSPR